MAYFVNFWKLQHNGVALSWLCVGVQQGLLRPAGFLCAWSHVTCMGCSALRCLASLYSGICCSTGSEVAQGRGLNNSELHRVHMPEHLCTAGWSIEYCSRDDRDCSSCTALSNCWIVTQVTPGQFYAAVESPSP